jgi:hypothetical protein
VAGGGLRIGRWKATPSLTVNFAVRYEYDEPWIESNDKTGNVNVATRQAIYADHVPTGAPIGSGVCSNRGCYLTSFYPQMQVELFIEGNAALADAIEKGRIDLAIVIGHEDRATALSWKVSPRPDR